MTTFRPVKYLLSIRLLLVLFVATLSLPTAEAASKKEPAYSAEEYGLGHDQHAIFPIPLSEYDKEEGDDWSIMQKLKHRAGQQGGFNLVASIIFLCAILHTFLSGYFIEMAHIHEKKHKEKIEKLGLTAEAKPHEDAQDHVSFKAHLFHFLGEVEAIFGIWVIALAGAVLWFFGIQGEGIGVPV